MIAYAAGELYALGHEDDYFLSPRSRWPLDENKAPMLGSGKRGAKA
jgi:N6-L-threonylcarbamoyladenine synthase